MTLREALESINDLDGYVAVTNGYQENAADALGGCDDGGADGYMVERIELTDDDGRLLGSGYSIVLLGDDGLRAGPDHNVTLVPVDIYPHYAG